MTTNIHSNHALGKLGDLLFARQTPVVAAEKHKGFLASIKAWNQYRAAEAELAGLSDRDLADIGLTRQGIRSAVRMHRSVG